MVETKKRFKHWLWLEAQDFANVHEALGFVRYSFDQWNGMFPKHSEMRFEIPEMKEVRLKVVKQFKK